MSRPHYTDLSREVYGEIAPRAYDTERELYHYYPEMYDAWIEYRRYHTALHGPPRLASDVPTFHHENIVQFLRDVLETN